MSGYDLPFVNAVLNGCAAGLLLAGFAAVTAGRVRLHKALMLSALAVSAAFLASYLTYHFGVRRGAETKYAGEGWRRTAYYAILISHILLAIATVPLALRSAWLGITNRIDRHRKWVRWTLPIWLYVSVTGVVVYQFLRGQYPSGD